MNDREDFDQIAEEVFFPAYEVIAQGALGTFGKYEGTCLDLGCGGGHLGLHIVKASKMDVILLDISEAALVIAEQRALDWGLAGRAKTLVSDVHHIGLPDNSCDLIVSRGSIGFWGNAEDMKQAFAEIHRVLAPDGVTYIGKGFGSSEVTEKIKAKMKTRHPEWPKSVENVTNGFDADDYVGFLSECGIQAVIINDERGVWILMRKYRKS